MIVMTNGEICETGCWISGWWGQYGPDRLIQIAAGFGFGEGDAQTTLMMDCALARLDDMATRGDAFEQAAERVAEWYNTCHADSIDAENPVIYEWIIDVSQEAEDYLNALLPFDDNGDPDAQFGWYEGEWYLLTAEEWGETE